MTEDELLAALRDWAPRSGITGLKDLHLRHVVKSGKRTAEELTEEMPPVISRNAQAVAAAIRDAAVPPDLRPESIAPRPERLTAEPPTNAPRHSASPVGVSPVDGEGFEPWDFLSTDGAPSALKIVVRQDGTQTISWTAKECRALYRLVVADEDEPYSPDDARLVAVTWGTDAVDVEPFTRAVRNFQVWRNEGDTESAAKAVQPVLHAAGTVVAPVPVDTIADDEGRVVGHWDALPGTTTVHVSRVPRERVASAAGQGAFRILAEARNLTGFIDSEAVPGQRYVYQVRAEAVTARGETLLSGIRAVPVEVPTRHDAVSDLVAAMRVDAGRFAVDLSWSSAVGGRVVIYRTPHAPSPGLDRKPIPAAALESAKLPSASRLNQPIEQDGGRSIMSDVPWPDDWPRAFFTPVVLLGDEAFVGGSARLAHIAPPRQIRIVERVSRQLLTFDWPKGADSMQVYRSATGAEAALAMHGEPMEVTSQDYREEGGFELGRDPLPRDGCDLHLVSVLFEGGSRVLSTPVTVHYPGIRRLHYTCVLKRQLTGRQSAVIVIESREVRIDGGPPFVLVYNPDRFPLSATDGRQIAMVRDSDDPGQPSVQIRPKVIDRAGDRSEGWRTDPDSWRHVVTASSGFVRLFVDVPPERARHIALMDPPLEQLRVKPGLFGGR